MLRKISFAILATMFAASAIEATAQDVPMREDIVRLAVEFKAAYLPNGQAPLKPTAVALHRWEEPIRIVMLSHAESTASNGVPEMVVPRLQKVLGQTLGNQPTVVDSPDEANVAIVVGPPDVVVGILSRPETLEKYFGGWDLGLGSFTALLNQAGCAFDFLSDPDGKIRSGIVMVIELSDPNFTAACISKGMMRAIGFEGAITDRKSIFASDADNVVLMPDDVDIIRLLYSREIPSGTPISEVIQHLDQYSLSVLNQ